MIMVSRAFSVLKAAIDRRPLSAPRRCARPRNKQRGDHAGLALRVEPARGAAPAPAARPASEGGDHAGGARRVQPEAPPHVLRERRHDGQLASSCGSVSLYPVAQRLLRGGREWSKHSGA